MHGLCLGALFVAVGGLEGGHGKCGGDITEFQEAMRPHASMTPCADLKVRSARGKQRKKSAAQHNGCK